MQNFGDFLFILACSIILAGLAGQFFARRRPSIRLSNVWADRAFLVLAILYIATFSTLAILRYLSFRTGYLGVDTSWDLGQYGQLIWNSLNGRLLEGTFVQDTRTFLGKSFTPILLAFVPLYAVWSSPIILLIVQVVGLGVGGFPIYWFARRQLGPWLGLAVALAYYLNPGLEYIGLTEFHEIALAVPLFAYATFFLLRKHHAGFLVCLALALLVKEEIGLIVIMFGVYIFLFQHNYRLGAALALFGLGWTVLLLQYLIPFFRGAEYGGTFYYFGEGTIGGGGSRYGYLGRNIPEILLTFLQRPQVIINHVWIPEKIAYVLHLGIPLVFLPLLGAEIALLALPTFGYSLLSTYPLQYEIRSYYFSPLLPILFFAAILGAERLIRWLTTGRFKFRLTGVQGFFITLLTTAGIMSYFLHGPGPGARDFQMYRYKLDAHAQLGNELITKIPSDAVVVAQNEFLAHLSNRKQIYEIPVIPDYRQTDYIFADSKLGWYRVHQIAWDNERAEGYFETLVEQDGYWLARRRTIENPARIQFGDALTFQGYTLPITSTPQGGTILRPVVSWVTNQTLHERYAMTIRIIDVDGHTWAEADVEPQDGAMPTTRWQIGKPIGDQYALKLPVTMPAGQYKFSINVHPIHENINLPIRNEQGDALNQPFVFGSVQIAKNTQSFLASELWIEQPLYVDMQEMRFLGSKPIPVSANRGETLPLGLYWRARSKPQSDYLVIIQMRDTRGRVVAEQSAKPAQGTYPTTHWNAGEVLLDWHDLEIPPNLAGDYTLFLGLRDALTTQNAGETMLGKISIK